MKKGAIPDPHLYQPMQWNIKSPHPLNVISSNPFLGQQDQTLLWTWVTSAHLPTAAGVEVTMSNFNTQKYIINCAQNIGCTCSMC